MQASSIYCTSCGAKNQPGARFCFSCGKPIQVGRLPEANSVPPTQYANPTPPSLPPTEYGNPAPPPYIDYGYGSPQAFTERAAQPTPPPQYANLYAPPLPTSAPKKQGLSRNAIVIISLIGIIVVGGIIALTVVLTHPGYPQLGSFYSGTVTDAQSNPPSTPMTLSSIVEDQQGNISGKLNLTGGNGFSTTFRGSVTRDHNISFSFPISNNNATVNFTGTIFSDGHLAGTWTETDNSNHGSWTVSPG